MSANQETTAQPPVTLKRHAYVYDAAGNRTVEQVDDTVTLATYNTLNRLVAEQPGGAIQFAGAVNEPAAVTIQGAPAIVDSANGFQATAAVSAGTNIVTIVATDGSGNQSTKQYQLGVSGTSKTFSYDANGNLTSDGSKILEWDARNQLLAVNVASHRSEFTYDGLYQRSRVTELDNSVMTSDHRFIWAQDVPVERRGGIATVRLFLNGLEESGTKTYLFRDHLDSVAVTSNQAGATLDRAEYSPFGSRTSAYGTGLRVTGYTGVVSHEPTGLLLMTRRAYEPSNGRWLSEDPLHMVDGPNLYAYVGNSPVQRIDPMGTQMMRWVFPKPPLPTLPTNGNIWNGFTQQDQRCSSIGSGMNSNPCAKRCCQDHDGCYERFRCNQSSWLRTVTNSQCGDCNLMITGCLLQASASLTGCNIDQCRP